MYEKGVGSESFGFVMTKIFMTLLPNEWGFYAKKDEIIKVCGVVRN